MHWNQVNSTMNTICHCGDFGVTIRKRHSGHCPPHTWLPFINCSHTKMVLLLGLIGIASWDPGIAGRAIGATGWRIYGTSLVNGFNVLIGQTFNHRILLSVAQIVNTVPFCAWYNFDIVLQVIHGIPPIRCAFVLNTNCPATIDAQLSFIHPSGGLLYILQFCGNQSNKCGFFGFLVREVSILIFLIVKIFYHDFAGQSILSMAFLRFSF